MLRRRKIEYDAVAEKINTLPSREELESSVFLIVRAPLRVSRGARTITSLENDMAAIRAEHDTQNRTIQGHKTALDTIVADLNTLKFMGKEPETPSVPQSVRTTPAPDTEPQPRSGESSLTSINTEEAEEEKEERIMIETAISEGETVMSEGMIEEENDIEMGEVEEDPRDKSKKKTLREEMEEGEATDASSELSEPPDD